jgi:predicted transcriptional regulator
MAEKDTLTFRTDRKQKQALDAIASMLQRDRSFVINEAIEAYVELHAWQAAHIEQGLEQARQGKFASEQRVKRVLKKLGTA